MIDRTHELPLVRQCQILELARSTAYYRPQPLSESDLALLRDLEITHPNHVWATDITYIPMKRGFV